MEATHTPGKRYTGHASDRQHMKEDTRERLLAAARQQFAERGFYGVSIAQVAGDLGLTKQALLYHFKRKEDLYAEVLQGISARLLASIRATVRRSDAPERQFEDIFLGFYASSREYPLDTRLLVRELLDNPARAQGARDWYLRPFLAEIVAVLQRVPGFESLAFSAAFCVIYQLLGSIEYFAISAATLRRMYDEETYERIRDDFPLELRSQIRRLIDAQRLAVTADFATPAGRGPLRAQSPGAEGPGAGSPASDSPGDAS